MTDSEGWSTPVHSPGRRPGHRRARRRTSAPWMWRWMPGGTRARLVTGGAFGALAVVALLLAILSPGGATRTPPTPPSPLAAGGQVSAPRETPHPSTTKHPRRQGFRCPTSRGASDGSTPVRICVPAIAVDATIMRLGLNADNTVQVPPLSRVRDAGWYHYSAQPGAVGASVILGHVDSAQYGDGVFFDLGQLRSGDSIEVTRADGRIATYRVGRVDEVSKQHFPTHSVYDRTSNSTIRLVTCGGRFDASTGSYLENIIVYGTLKSLT